MKLTFFVTRDGYMGLGLCFLRPGDLIASFDGGATPFATRKARSGMYQLICDVCVHGLMDGVTELSELDDISLD